MLRVALPNKNYRQAASANCNVKTTGRRLSAEPAFGYGLFCVAFAECELWIRMSMGELRTCAKPRRGLAKANTIFRS
jgi:hypothetical protein